MIPLWTSKRGGPPEPITALTPAAWYRYGVGIEVTGSGVSKWPDQSGNGRDLLQGTDAARPALQSDNSILFDGGAHFLKCSTFTFAQPETIYALYRQVTWTLTDTIFDGNTSNTGAVRQSSVTPQLEINAGAAQVATNANLAVNTYGVMAVVFNGASSLLQINNTTATTGSPGTASMSGFTLGARGDSTQFSNIQVKEVILFAAAHDAATRTAVITYLATVGGLNI